MKMTISDNSTLENSVVNEKKDKENKCLDDATGWSSLFTNFCGDLKTVSNEASHIDIPENVDMNESEDARKKEEKAIPSDMDTPRFVEIFRELFGTDFEYTADLISLTSDYGKNQSNQSFFPSYDEQHEMLEAARTSQRKQIYYPGYFASSEERQAIKTLLLYFFTNNLEELLESKNEEKVRKDMGDQKLEIIGKLNSSCGNGSMNKRGSERLREALLHSAQNGSMMNQDKKRMSFSSLLLNDPLNKRRTVLVKAGTAMLKVDDDLSESDKKKKKPQIKKKKSKKNGYTLNFEYLDLVLLNHFLVLTSSSSHSCSPTATSHSPSCLPFGISPTNGAMGENNASMDRYDISYDFDEKKIAEKKDKSDSNQNQKHKNSHAHLNNASLAAMKKIKVLWKRDYSKKKALSKVIPIISIQKTVDLNLCDPQDPANDGLVQPPETPVASKSSSTDKSEKKNNFMIKQKSKKIKKKVGKKIKKVIRNINNNNNNNSIKEKKNEESTVEYTNEDDDEDPHDRYDPDIDTSLLEDDGYVQDSDDDEEADAQGNDNDDKEIIHESAFQIHVEDPTDKAQSQVFTIICSSPLHKVFWLHALKNAMVGAWCAEYRLHSEEKKSSHDLLASSLFKGCDGWWTGGGGSGRMGDFGWKHHIAHINIYSAVCCGDTSMLQRILDLHSLSSNNSSPSKLSETQTVQQNEGQLDGNQNEIEEEKGEQKSLHLLSQCDSCGFTAIQYAIIKNQIPCLRILLDAGIDPNVKSKHSHSALDYANAIQDVSHRNNSLKSIQNNHQNANSNTTTPSPIASITEMIELLKTHGAKESLPFTPQRISSNISGNSDTSNNTNSQRSGGVRVADLNQKERENRINYIHHKSNKLMQAAKQYKESARKFAKK